MTNFEWLLLPKNRELLRNIIINSIGVKKNDDKICSCDDITCSICKFDGKCLSSTIKDQFLNKEYEMHYDFNKGDIVIVSLLDGQQLIGFFNGEFGEKVYVTPYLNNVGKFKENGIIPSGNAYRKNAVEITAYERN